MRSHSSALPAPAKGSASASSSDWHTLKTLLPYLWEYRWRVGLALLCLVSAKLANVGVPIVLKKIVDTLAPSTPLQAAVVVPLALILAYGLLRLSTTLFTELREIVFVKVTMHAVRTISLQVFRHLHGLSLRFHLERRTGGLTRDIERGTAGVGSLVSYTLYSIVPTLTEIALVLTYLVINYEVWFAVITVCALTLYILFTVLVTNWRTQFRREMNELESKASVRAVDSLLNFETVKYFNNEDYEANRYDKALQKHIKAKSTSQYTLSILNLGQSCIIAIAVTLMVWRATVGVSEGRMTLGDLVLVNAFMIQLYIPLNFLGVLYREIKQSLADMERLFGLLAQHREVQDSPTAQALPLPQGRAGLEFSQVQFAYVKERPILHGLSFEAPAGSTTAIVGPSGAGKSTLARLLYRFYDVSGGAIRINGQDLRELTQISLRQAIGIVPQDTVLFNDSIAYNIAYGRPGASQQEIEAAAKAAQLHGFIASLPDGYNTSVGERGLKLSGGEKQRVAIARMILKNPPIVILDEATSALDTRNEQAIQEALRVLAQNRTTLIIAHRLSTIIDADQILVVDAGVVAERGTHQQLLDRQGIYAQMWAAQSDTSETGATE
jgi:ATP-binding cassette, subfamily B, heavy metal transporter